MGPVTRPITQPDPNLWMISSRICGACPARHVCGSQHSVHACPDDLLSLGPSSQLHPQDPDADQMTADLGSFDFPNASTPVKKPGFPAFIPWVRLGNHAKWRFPSWVAVPLHEVLLEDGTVHDVDRVRRSLNLRSDQRVVISCHVKDKLLGRVWRKRTRFVRSLRDAGFDSILAPGFSVWSTHCRFQQLTAIAQSNRLFESLHLEGVRAVPHVSGFTDRDWRRAGLWLAAHSEVEIVCVDVQRSRQHSSWTEEMAALRLLRSTVGRPLRWVVNGVSQHRRIEELSRTLGDLTVVSADVYMRAVKGRQPWPVCGNERSDLAKHEIFARSSSAFAGFVRGLSSDQGIR